MEKDVFIIGPSGFYCLDILPSLREAGYRIVGMVTREEEAEYLIQTIGNGCRFDEVAIIIADGTLKRAEDLFLRMLEASNSAKAIEYSFENRGLTENCVLKTGRPQEDVKALLQAVEFLVNGG